MNKDERPSQEKRAKTLHAAAVAAAGEARALTDAELAQVVGGSGKGGIGGEFRK